MKIILFVDQVKIYEREISNLLKEELQDIGAIGELTIWEILRQKGYRVVRLGMESPVDLLILNPTIAINVKLAKKSYNNAAECYAFLVTNKLANFVIVWAININEYFIIPSSELKIGVNRIYPNAPKWLKYKAAWLTLSS